MPEDAAPGLGGDGDPPPVLPLVGSGLLGGERTHKGGPEAVGMGGLGGGDTALGSGAAPVAQRSIAWHKVLSSVKCCSYWPITDLYSDASVTIEPLEGRCVSRLNERRVVVVLSEATARTSLHHESRLVHVRFLLPV